MSWWPMAQGEGWMRGGAAATASPDAGAGKWLVVVAGHTTTCKTKQNKTLSREFFLLLPPSSCCYPHLLAECVGNAYAFSEYPKLMVVVIEERRRSRVYNERLRGREPGEARRTSCCGVCFRHNGDNTGPPGPLVSLLRNSKST